MKRLLVGFDSAWTPANCGAIVGVIQGNDGTHRELGPPITVNFRDAERAILAWQGRHQPASTIVLLDQPTIVRNASGQRPVEHLLSSIVCRRYGAMQPANTAKEQMFGTSAPVWGFLTRFGGGADPLAPSLGTQVFETYPVVTMIALGWTLPDSRATGRLPKYNPQRRKTFSRADWEYVCSRASKALIGYGFGELSDWIDGIAQLQSPRKPDQDALDACLCLLMSLYLAEGKAALMIGDQCSGYVVMPDSVPLRQELDTRCQRTQRTPSDWIRLFRLPVADPEAPA